MLDNVSAKLRDQIKVCLRISDEGIRNAQLEATTKDRKRYWGCWKNFAGIMGVDPFLDPRKVPYQLKVRALTSLEQESEKECTERINRLLVEQLAKQFPQSARRSAWLETAEKTQ